MKKYLTKHASAPAIESYKDGYRVVVRSAMSGTNLYVSSKLDNIHIAQGYADSLRERQAEERGN